MLSDLRAYHRKTDRSRFISDLPHLLSDQENGMTSFLILQAQPLYVCSVEYHWYRLCIQPTTLIKKPLLRARKPLVLTAACFRAAFVPGGTVTGRD